MKFSFPNEVEINTDKSRLPIQEIYNHLITTYWATNRSFKVVEKSIQNSLCFGMYKENNLIGFARIITDYAVFAYLCDVYILPKYQGNGYGKMLIHTIQTHPELQGLRRWMLATKNAHGLYKQFGYSEIENPSRWMEIFNNNS